MLQNYNFMILWNLFRRYLFKVWCFEVILMLILAFEVGLVRLFDIEYFRWYSILSNKAFVTLFVTFFKSSVIDIEYSLLFLTGIDIGYSIISRVIGQNQYQYYFKYFFWRLKKRPLFKIWNTLKNIRFFPLCNIFSEV